MNALAAQLAAIIGREPATSLIEVRPITPEGRPARERAFVPVGERTKIEQLTHELAARMNVFYGVCPRVRAEGTAAAVDRCWTLWADLDTHAAFAQLDTFAPAPALVILTGSGGGHAYWPLHEPLEPSHAQRANRRLAFALGGDMAATDPARILRAASSLNHKHSPPRSVTCARLTGELFTASRVVGRLADSQHYRRRAPAARIHDAGDPSRVLGGLARTVREAQPGNRNHCLYWAACRLREHTEAGDLDEQSGISELRDAARAVGLGEIEVEQTLRSGLGRRETVAA